MNDRELENAIIRDYISDIRFATRMADAQERHGNMGEEENRRYAESCRADLRKLLEARKASGRIARDRNGWPLCLKSEAK